LWENRTSNGPDATLNLFWNASVFPDDARGQLFGKYSRPAAHYVNYRVMSDRDNAVEPPLPGESVLNTYEEFLRQVRDPATPIEDRAVALSWIFHQSGDIHQPLHAVARFSRALPNGDRGGNEARVPISRSSGAEFTNLHAFWDGALGP